jgi:hypothetical protein
MRNGAPNFGWKTYWGKPHGITWRRGRVILDYNVKTGEKYIRSRIRLIWLEIVTPV